MSSKNNDLIVEMRGIVKRFPGVLAIDHVGFTLRRGEIHALLGENGAGKSTLMNVLSGLYRAESGSILIKGKPEIFNSPRDAINSGIGMVHQHFMLVPSQTVTENILLGLKEPRFRLHLHEYEKKVDELSHHFGMKVDPRAKIWQLSVGEQQRVEILKMLYRGAEVLILDEPTAVLAPQEVEGLFNTLRNMVSDGKSIIFISHKLNEVLDIAQKITVLRKGTVVASDLNVKDITRAELAKLMVGREVVFNLEKKPSNPGEIILDVKNIHSLNDKGLPALQGVTLNVRAGEIVGLAGVAGNGQRELAQVIAGLRKCTEGSVLLNGLEISNFSVKKVIGQGLGYIPEDRALVGTAPNLSITDNVIMKKYRKAPISRGWVMDMQIATKFAKGLRKDYEIIVPSVETPVRLLSGGNLQRVILAREISGRPSFLLAMQPTRGLDVGAIEGVHNLLLKQRDEGSAILMVSEELEELMAISDRIYVIYEGKIMGEVKDRDIETIGKMMTGTPLQEIMNSGVS
ncbi:MAG: ABC transporter ATP-binding protein [Anaerolineales bacterium]|nr:ABC transporter ATP-binding protein [Anaerolineales bacterium]